MGPDTSSDIETAGGTVVQGRREEAARHNPRRGGEIEKKISITTMTIAIVTMGDGFLSSGGAGGRLALWL